MSAWYSRTRSLNAGSAAPSDAGRRPTTFAFAHGPIFPPVATWRTSESINASLRFFAIVALQTVRFRLHACDVLSAQQSFGAAVGRAGAVGSGYLGHHGYGADVVILGAVDAHEDRVSVVLAD